MGKVIEFYHPSPKPRPVPQPEVDEAEEQMPAGMVLQQLLDRANTIRDVLVMMVDADGNAGMVTNVNGLPESLLFIERVKHQIMVQDAANNRNGPKGTA